MYENHAYDGAIKNYSTDFDKIMHNVSDLVQLKVYRIWLLSR